MIFCHFTSEYHLQYIMTEGLLYGEVPISETKLLQAVWLTTDKDPAGHGLSSGQSIQLPDGRTVSTYDKRAVRITVKIAKTDSCLKHWPRWAKKRLRSDWYEALDQTGGGKSDSWWLYWGSIPPETFIAIDRMEARV